MTWHYLQKLKILILCDPAFFTPLVYIRKSTISFLRTFFLSFFFSFLHLTYSILLVSGVQPSDSHNLQSDQFSKSSTHLALYIVITMLLTIFPMLCFISCDYFVATNLCSLIPSPFSPIPSIPLHHWKPSKCILFFRFCI